MTALIDGDLAAASAAAGHPLSPYLVEEAWLWQVRRDQLKLTPQDADWIARAAVDAATGAVAGHGGFHAAPDGDGAVEVAYSVDPLLRRRGYAKAILAALLERARKDPAVRVVRASVRPDNAGSLATIARFGFRKTGEQWDPEDGLEYVFLKDVGD